MKPFYTDWDEFKDAQLCNAWVATAIIGSSVLGAGASIFGAKTAANAQINAANQAAAIQQQQFNTTRADLEPYRNAGSDATSKLQANNYYTAPIDISSQLQDPNNITTKAYNFNLTQGNKAVQNSAAARGLGVSGAALKGAANFTTGLADNTYQSLFNIANTNQTNAYNRLKGIIDTGENAAAGGGVIGQHAATGAATSIMAGGNAAAAADNAIGTAGNKLATNIGGYYAYKGLYGNNNSGNNGDTNVTFSG